jgi:agmatine deiminase
MAIMADNSLNVTLNWPAEWQQHCATWIAWPHNHDDWPNKFEPIPWVYAEIVRWLRHSETVHILVRDAAEERTATRVLEFSHVPVHGIRFHHVRTNRVWTRDYAPIFVYDHRGHKVALKWQFRGWSKYPDWQDDNEAGLEIAKLTQASVVHVSYQGRPVVLEGGAIDSNGAGVILATEECLLSEQQQRNPGFGREDYEKLFQDWLGARQVIWLARGLLGDDTHGHIDDIARFAGPDTILLVKPTDRQDPNYAIYEENYELLRKQLPATGRSWRIVELPLPEPRFFQGQRLPASYANFYVANRVVLVPTFNDPADRAALNVLGELFFDRTVVGIYSGDLILGLGALHCLTMQEPV